jgi:hypothetical protein
VNRADAGESEGERPEIRHTEKSDGNPCFGVRGSNRTSTENRGKLRFFSAHKRKRQVFPENKRGKQKWKNKD